MVRRDSLHWYLCLAFGVYSPLHMVKEHYFIIHSFSSLHFVLIPLSLCLELLDRAALEQGADQNEMGVLHRFGFCPPLQPPFSYSHCE